jgi:hypothetical protein|tara:strand:+ start:1045 stop:1485 length:441 start_codon:yes stop_codon:yes gene_type:complete
MSNLNEKVLNYIETTGKAIKVALDLVQTGRGADASKVASAVEKLENANLIDINEVKQASAQLADHGEALDVLHNVIDHYSSELKGAQAKVASATIGEGVSSEKRASSSTEKYANYVGRVRGSDDEPADSDKALLSLIDGYNPGNSM